MNTLKNQSTGGMTRKKFGTTVAYAGALRYCFQKCDKNEPKDGRVEYEVEEGDGLRSIYRANIDHPAGNDKGNQCTSEAIKHLVNNGIGIERYSDGLVLKPTDTIYINPVAINSAFNEEYDKCNGNRE